MGSLCLHHRTIMKPRALQTPRSILLRATLLLAVIATTLCTGVTAAAANTVERTRTHESFDMDFGSDLCGFPLTAHAQMKTTTKTFLDGSGQPIRGIVTGPIAVWFTNGLTGSTVRTSVPGPIFFDAQGQPVRGTGAWASFTSDGELVWAAGQIELDRWGTILSIRGMSRSVCDLVA